VRQQVAYGKAVVIDHGGRTATLYAHLARVDVAVGQAVAAGDAIGTVGSTGFATGPHLHYEVRVEGEPVDPRPYL
jgi:murein DD-endopeptidase MepM/ murein hydrolase activator NlpD